MVTLRRLRELRLTIADNGSGIARRLGIGARLVEAREQTTDRFWSYLPAITMYIYTMDLSCIILYHAFKWQI